MRARFARTAVGALFGLCLLGLPAKAACPGPNAAVAEMDPQARLEFLNRHLRAELAPSRTWTLAFGTFYGVASLGQLAIAPTAKPVAQADWYVGAASTGVGSVVLMLAPLGVLEDAPRLSDAPVGMDAGEVCKLVLDAEKRFVRDADGEALGRSLLAHIGNVIVNAAGLLWLGLGYHRWETGFLNFGVGMVIGEGMILTQPHALPRAWKAYEAANLY